jgi:hypothetical protein
MASRDRLIAVACEVALDRRFRTDEDRIAATQARFADGTAADLAAAEFWAIWAGTVVEEAEAAGDRDLGRWLVQRVRDNHRAGRLR